MNSALTALRKNQSVFLRLAEMRSVSDTAVALGVTPGAISQSLKKLEISLGLVLFDRQCRPLKLDGTQISQDSLYNLKSL